MPVIAIALAAALGGAALQDQAEPRVEHRSEIRIVSTDDGDGPGRLDANGDGEVTREEFSAPMGNAFDRLDANHDGRLSAEELAAGHGGPGGPGRHMMIMGPDGPGGPGGPGVRVFTSRMDGHGGPGERDVRIITRGGPGGPEGLGGHGMPMIIHGAPGGPGGQVHVFTTRVDGDVEVTSDGPGQQQVFVRRFGPDGHGDMDKDGDGKVSQEEFLAPMREVFQRMDADHDGFLDEGEDRPTPPSGD